MLNRRIFVASAGGLAVLVGLRWSNRSSAVAEPTFEVQKSEAEWRRILTPAQFNVLRKHDTERPGSSPLDHEKRKGTFVCAGCDLPLFSSEAKFESHTGWPSFSRPLAGGGGTRGGRAIRRKRTEASGRG